MDDEKPISTKATPDADVHYEPNTDPAELFPEVSERKLMFKVDCWIMPLLACLFFLSSLDKTNVANAKIFNLSEDLHLKSNEYNNCLVIYFVAYVVFDIPFTMVMRTVKPHIWLSLCTFCFGIVAMCQGFVKSYSGLLAVRFSLGITESPSFSCCFYIIGMWYTRPEAQKRFSFFYSSIQLAGAFAGLLASAIGLLNGDRGYLAWRWIFIIEGAVTATIGAIFFFILPDFPAQTKWLSPVEKKFILTRLAQDRGAEEASNDKLTLKTIFQIIRQPKILLGGLMYFTIVVPAYGYAYFVPTIIHSYTESAIRTQLLSVPPWACGFVTSMVVAWISDRVRHRFLFIAIPLLLAVAGYVMLFTIHHHPHVQYAALFLVVIGIWTALPVQICWFAMNVAGSTRRSVALGWQIGFGNIGGIVAVYLFLSNQAPLYRQGYATSLAFILVTMLFCTAYLLFCWKENKAKRRALSEGRGEDKNKEMGMADDLDLKFMNLL